MCVVVVMCGTFLLQCSSYTLIISVRVVIKEFFFLTNSKLHGHDFPCAPSFQVE